MNVQCNAMAGLLAAGIGVVAAAEASAANQGPLPNPIVYSTAGLFTPIAQSASLTIPAALRATVTVTVNGSRFLSGTHSGCEPHFYNSPGPLVEPWHYTWDPAGPVTQWAVQRDRGPWCGRLIQLWTWRRSVVV